MRDKTIIYDLLKLGIEKKLVKKYFGIGTLEEIKFPKNLKIKPKYPYVSMLLSSLRFFSIHSLRDKYIEILKNEIKRNN
ncbi:MAG: hypothetical protein ACP5G1_04085 [Nanopusillaceae archaeon]